MSSPQTPRHSPHPSFDFPSTASYGSYSPRQERRQSKASSYYNDSSVDLGIPGGPGGLDVGGGGGGGIGGGGGGGGGGLGNLADELAGAFSEGEDDDYDDDEHGYGDGEGDGAEGTPGISLSGLEAEIEDGGRRAGKDGAVRDSGVDVESPLGGGRRIDNRSSLGLPAANGRGHRRAGSEYDGSEYGSESDLELPGLPPKLVEKMDEVESLARRGAENTGSATDGAFQRVTEGLRDLGSQAGVEGGATR